VFAGGPDRGTLLTGKHLRPDLAEAERTVSRHRKTYTFTIRRGACFSAGATVTARAFARALERIRDPAHESGLVADFRQAINFAIDRRALTHEPGPFGGRATDQYLLPVASGFRDERIYPLKAPNLSAARALAKGHLRGGKAVLYAPAIPLGLAQAHILKENLMKIGLDVDVQTFPAPVVFQKLATPGEPFDIGWIGWEAGFPLPDPSSLLAIFDGRTIGRTDNYNYSYFDSPRYNALLERASRLTGDARARAYGDLDVDLARNAAPAIALSYDNVLTLVSDRTRCVVVRPYLDLAAVCLR
jgi:ABC-type transport system substrate-binding protein